MVNQTKQPALPLPIEIILSENEPVVTALRAAFSNALAIYVFGSRIDGTAAAGSDLDLAVLVAGYAEPLTLWSVSAELADQLGCDVDLLDMCAASTVMQYQIVQNGRRLWGNALQEGLFVCFVLSEKLVLDEARAVAVRDSIPGKRVCWMMF